MNRCHAFCSSPTSRYTCHRWQDVMFLNHEHFQIIVHHRILIHHSTRWFLLLSIICFPLKCDTCTVLYRFYSWHRSFLKTLAIFVSFLDSFIRWKVEIRAPLMRQTLLLLFFRLCRVLTWSLGYNLFAFAHWVVWVNLVWKFVSFVQSQLCQVRFQMFRNLYRTIPGMPTNY